MKWQTKFSLIDDAETTREKKLQYLEKSVISLKEPFMLQIVWAFHREKNGNECWKKRNNRQKRCWAATRRNAKKWRQVFHGHITFLSITRQKTKKERLFFSIFQLPFKTLFAYGAIGHVICSVGKEEKAECIILGSRGLGTIRRTILGSVSDYVTQHMTIPVLLVPAEERR